jgi:hypothetical protein
MRRLRISRSRKEAAVKVKVGVGLVLVGTCLAWAPVANAQGTPSGERTLGQSSIEPAYDDMTGKLIYLLTPLGVSNPVKSNAKAAAPLYLIVYPTSAGAAVGPMNCQHAGGDNCPDHGPEIAGAAAFFQPSVYGDGVWGHDHLVDAPGGSEFNVAWEVHVLLFTNSDAANTHVTTEDEMDTLLESGDLVDTFIATTFNCSVVPAATYKRGTPVTPLD